ncbi:MULTISPECIES: phasin [unclassified Methylobacterium]|uniref:phasin n=1 Tax=unclassified Methylobacterium TaxID=2615210 RepID=UPI0006F2CE4A|nr:MULTISPECIES: phasin [unclassified Methylobacterium]KQP54184.1 phasin [Methylobacterium sp. Leaf108]KQT78820.1 phasin [Methylobacterium sp. Leaf466]
MNAPTFEIPAEMRDFAEKSVDQARNAVGTLIGTAVKASEQTQTLQSSMQGVVAKGLDHVQTNANATFDFAQKLVRTRDLREAFTLQAEFLKSQMAALQAQAKDLGALAQTAVKPAV